jgi:hypothetical protein
MKKTLNNIAICGVLAVVGASLPSGKVFAQDKPSLTQEQLEKLKIEERELASKAKAEAEALARANDGCDDCGRGAWLAKEKERAAEAARQLMEKQRAEDDEWAKKNTKICLQFMDIDHCRTR